MAGATKKFEAACHELRDGTISFTEFRARTQTNWDSLARYILRRWNCPPSVSEEDVAQELLLAAWRLVGVWDPARPKAWPLGRFLVWRACNVAKAWVHHQRSAKHSNVDRQPGRFAISFSQLYANGEREQAYKAEERLGVVDATQEEEVDVRRAHRRIAEGLPVDQGVAFAALMSAGGDCARAAEVLYNDPTARRLARLGSEKQAERKIAKAYELLLVAAS